MQGELQYVDRWDQWARADLTGFLVSDMGYTLDGGRS
jgi:hypothetical protein